MTSKLTLSHEDAVNVIAVITGLLNQRELAAVIAVADCHGELIALHRLDGAPLPSILIATNKAWTAAREGKTTKVIGTAARDPKNGFDVAFFGDKRYIGWGGGVPIIHQGRSIGAVAVSGLSEELDEELANAGIKAIVPNAS
jgi:glc operon protein GlcG